MNEEAKSFLIFMAVFMIPIAVIVASGFGIAYWGNEHHFRLPRRRKVLMKGYLRKLHVMSAEMTQSGLAARNENDLFLLNLDGSVRDCQNWEWWPLKGFSKKELAAMPFYTKADVMASFQRINGEGVIK